MFDWWTAATNGLWILGLSIILAAVSYHQWVVRQGGRHLPEILNEPSFRLAAATGMALVSVGWELSQAHGWWNKALWTILVLVFGWDIVALTRAGGKLTRLP